MTREEYQQVAKRFGEGYFLRQLAEECCELGHVALKVVRSCNGETPVCVEDSRKALIEEMADVYVMLDLLLEYFLTEEEFSCVQLTQVYKVLRMAERLCGAESEGGGAEHV